MLRNRAALGSDGTLENMAISDIEADTAGGSFSRYSCSFDGVNQFVRVGDVLGFEFDEARSFSFWVKPAAGGTSFVISKNAGFATYRGLDLSYDTAIGEIWFSLYHDYAGGAGDFLQVKTGNVLVNGVWQHVCVTYDGSSLAAGVAIIVDDVNQALGVNRDTLLGAGTITNAQDLCIARRGDGTFYLNANVDEVSFYDAELTAPQVSEIFNSGVPTNLFALTSEPDMTAWWRMGDG